MGTNAQRAASQVADVVVRAATPADLAEVAAMERACYADPWPVTAFASLPENPAVYFAVARSRATGALAGYAIVWHVVDEAELANLAVDPAARRRGIGRGLLDAMLRDCDQRGTRRVFLEVRESNAAARALYASRGFEEVGRRKQYYRSPLEDALILRRDRQ
jgi:ribosomal-protein-alanine N-acetyltransferase